MNFWQYQSANPWSRRDGTLTDQSRLWLNSLFKTVTTQGQGPIQLGGDIGGTSTTPIVIGLQGKPIGAQVPTNGQVLAWSTTNGDWEPKTAAAGTVTSVRLAMPPEFSVSGSPVTGAGTLTAEKANQNANQVYAGPASGGAAQPTFRALASADVPAASTSAAGGIQLARDLGGTAAAPTVIGLQARPVAATAPTDGQLLTWVAANNDWEPKGVPTSNLSVKGVLVGLVNVSPILVNGHAIS